jgi:oxygen-dependent protoporphyrinogen oxidase
LIAGVFVADAHKLSLAATFPEFLDAEREHGSLWTSVKSTKHTAARTQSAARYGQFVSLRGGVRTLVEALANALPAGSIRIGKAVRELSKVGPKRWVVTTDPHAAPDLVDGVIVTASSSRAAALINPIDESLANKLRQIEYASSVVVTLIYKRDQIARLLDGFGAVVPAVEERPSIALSFTNVKFPEWAPPEYAVVRVFMGGVLRPEIVERPDDELIGIARSELGQLIGAGGSPIFEPLVMRWRESMPQYEVGHLKRVAEIESRVSAHRGLQLAGNAYHGVGIPQCIRSGRTAAEGLIEQLLGSTHTTSQ